MDERSSAAHRLPLAPPSAPPPPSSGLGEVAHSSAHLSSTFTSRPRPHLATGVVVVTVTAMSSSALRRLSARFPAGLHPRPHQTRSGRPLISIVTYNRFPTRSLTSSSTPFSSASSPPRTHHLDGSHPSSSSSSSSSSLPSLPMLTFPELSTYAARFLTDFWDSPPADSRDTALTLLASLRSLHPQSPAQLSVQTRLIESLSEALGELPVPHAAEDEAQGEGAPEEGDEEGGVLVDRVVAHAVPSMADASIESVVVELHEDVGGVMEGGGGRGVRLRFHEAYSTDQMLVDSLPTLDKEEIVQIGRRDVSRLLGN